MNSFDRKPNKRTFYKFLYLFLRYFALASQMFVSPFLFSLLFSFVDVVCDRANEIITVRLGDRALDEHTCKSWYTFQIITAQSILSAVEIILMLRGTSALHP